MIHVEVCARVELFQLESQRGQTVWHLFGTFFFLSETVVFDEYTCSNYNSDENVEYLVAVGHLNKSRLQVLAMLRSLKCST